MSNMRSESVRSRRGFLQKLTRLSAFAGISQLLPGDSITAFAQNVVQKIKGKERLIVRSLRPEDLETPPELFTSWLTPNDLFYVRHHLYAPDINVGEWKLTVDGEVSTPLSLSLEDLRKLPKASVTVTLECAGNGRAFYEPAVAGIQWEKGAVGTAKWAGARLADVLKKAGIKSSAKFIFLNGADKSIGTMPDFIRQVPLEKAIHPETILAYEMNNESLPPLHGYPLRAVVPGWEGAYAVKWLNHITVSDKENEGFFVKTAYRYPTKLGAPGAAVDPKDMAPLTGLIVKSIISAPTENTTIKTGNVLRVMGWAWAGESNITRVDISFDNGTTWTPAKLGREQARYAWRQFEYEWRPVRPGSFLVMARATDDKGRVQPVAPTWNPSGYLWNVIDRIRVNVEA